MAVMLPSPSEWAHLPWPQRERAVRNARGLLALAFPQSVEPAPSLAWMDPSDPQWAQAVREHAAWLLSRTAPDPLAAVNRARLMEAVA